MTAMGSCIKLRFAHFLRVDVPNHIVHGGCRAADTAGFSEVWEDPSEFKDPPKFFRRLIDYSL